MICLRLAGSIVVMMLIPLSGCLDYGPRESDPLPSSSPSLAYFADCHAAEEVHGAPIPCPSPQTDARFVDSLDAAWRCLADNPGQRPGESFGWRVHAIDGRVAFTYSGIESTSMMHGALYVAQGGNKELLSWRSGAEEGAVLLPPEFEAIGGIEYEVTLFEIDYELNATDPASGAPLAVQRVEPAWSHTQVIELMHRASSGGSEWHFVNRVELATGPSTLQSFRIDGTDFDFSVQVSKRIFAIGTISAAAMCTSPGLSSPG